MNTLSIILMAALVVCLVVMVLGYFGLKKKSAPSAAAIVPVISEIKNDLTGFMINVEAGAQAVGSDLSQWFRQKQDTAQAEADAAALLIKGGYTVTAPTTPPAVPVP